MKVNRYEGYIESSFLTTELYIRKDLIENPKGIILFLHGVIQHSGMYKEITEYYNKMGYSVYRYDQRGHGLTKGKPGYIDDWKDLVGDLNKVINLIKEENPNIPVYVIGFSMGGFVAVNYGIIYPNEVDGLILVGPFTLGNIPGLENFVKNTILADNPLVKNFIDKYSNIVDLEKFIKIFENHRDLEVPLFPRKIEFYIEGLISAERVKEVYFSDPYILEHATPSIPIEFCEGVKFLSDKLDRIVDPVFILHGIRDMMVDYRDSQKVFDSISSEDKAMKFYDAPHTILMEEDRSSWDDIIEWIER